MRRGGRVLPLLLCFCLAGCFTGDSPRTPGWAERMGVPHVALGPDGVLLDLVVLEMPLGDTFINKDIWECANVRSGGLECHGLLADNGLRTGPVIGMIPDQLQNLLNSPRHCFSKRRQILPGGQTTAVAVGPALPVCSFRLHTAEGDSDIELEQGQPTLIIAPSLADGGRIRLKFTPEVLYGTVGPNYSVAPDRSGRVLEFKRPNKTYPALSWEVTVAPNQCLLVGSVFDDRILEDAMPTLGNQFFLQEQRPGQVQRLLVIRTMRGEAPEGEWSAVTAQMPDSDNAEGGAAAASPTQSIAPAAHCLAASGH